MKPLKYALMALAGVAALALVAVAIIAANFDADKFKADITRLVKDKTQRTLAIDGAIKLAFFPKVGVELGKLSLSEHKGDKVFAAVNSARVSVDLLPLLRKRIVVDRIAVDGLSASLTRRKDGSSNFDDLLGRPAAPGGEQDAAAPGLKLDIAGIEISNTAIQWSDEAKNERFAIKVLQFKTGRLGNAAPSKFELALGLSGDHPKLDVQISASGNLSIDLEARHYRVAGLAAAIKGNAAGVALDKLDVQGTVDFKPAETVLDALVVKFSGKHGGDRIDASLDIPKALLAKDRFSVQKISSVIRLTQANGNLNATLTVPGMEGSGRAFKAGDLKLDLEGKQGENAIKGSLSSPVSGNVEAKRYELPKLAATLNVTGPNLPKGAVALSLVGHAVLDLARKTVQSNLAAKLAESNISARLDLTRFSPPSLAFDLNIDQLNLDQYLPPSTGQQARKEPEKPIDLSGLKAVNASGTIRIGALQASRLKAANINAQVRLANGRLEVSPHSAKLYQGSAAGALTADANGNRYALKESLNGVSIGPLLKDLADKDVLEGRGNVALDLSASGNSVRALKKSLAGTARTDLKDGAVKGINLGQALRQAKSALGAKGATEQSADKQDKTDFSELSASFVVRNGVAHNEDLSLKSPFLRLSGSGDINIGDDSIDYLAKAAVVASAAGQGGKDLGDLKGIAVPVRLSGPFDALKYRIDFGAMAGELAKEKAKEAVTNAITEKLGIGTPKPGGQNTDPKDQAREALKGLFKR